MGNRKYPKTTGYYPYYHRLPNKMCYFGMSKQQPSKRWQPSTYKDKSLGPYIEQYGWDNIEHGIITDGLTKHQAEVIEDWFIKNATKDGFCLNVRRSGGKARDNRREWQREYEQRPERKQHKREYRKTEKWKEYKREWQRQYYWKKKTLKNEEKSEF